jgi:hypothetical protein
LAKFGDFAKVEIIEFKMSKKLTSYKKKSIIKSKDINTEVQIPKTSNIKSENKKIAFILTPFYLIISLLTIPAKIILLALEINQNYLYIFILLNSLLIFYSLYFLDIKNSNYIFKTIFVIYFATTLSANFISINPESSEELVVLYRKIMYYIRFIILPTATIGSLLLWMNRGKFLEVINKRFSKSETNNSIENQRNKSRFHFTKNSFLIVILFLIITIGATYTLFYKLDRIDLYSDEAQVTQTAYGYLQTGEYKQWDFVKNEITESKNNRATPHLFLVAQAYKIFGISNWSTRFFSVLFGIIFISLTFLITLYFTKNKTTAFIVAFSALFYNEYLLLFRWGRMYALLIPIYLLTSFLLYKAVTDENKINFRLSPINDFVKKYLNFNFIALIISLFLIVINFKVHVNSMMLVLIFATFLIYLVLADYKLKYLIAILTGIVLFFIYNFTNISINNFSIKSNSYITLFGVNNFDAYSPVFSQFPLNYYSSLIILLISMLSLILIRNTKYRNITVFNFLNLITGVVIFSFIFDYPLSFRYISFLIIFSMFLIVDFSIIFFETLYTKTGKYVFSVFVIIATLFSFQQNYSNIYTENKIYPAHPSIAYKIITDNAIAGDALFYHWGAKFYFNDINPEVETFELGGQTSKPFDTIYNELRKYQRGWITWDSYNGNRIDSTFQTYCSKYFTKYHGFGIDSTNVEVFYFEKDMLIEKDIFYNEMLMPHANLNLSNSFTLSFWIAINNKIENNPFFINSDTTKIIRIRPTINKKGIKFKYSTLDSIRTPDIADNKLHHIVFYQDIERDKFGVYVDAKFIAEKNIPEINDSLVKFIYNLQSKDYTNNVRIFLHALNLEEIEALHNDGIPLKKNEVLVDEEILESDFFWIKNF